MTQSTTDASPARSTAMADTRRPLAIDDILELRPLAQPCVSPDGASAIVVAQRCDRKKNKYFHNLVRIDCESRSTRPFTVGDHKDHSPAWSPDGAQVAFVSDRSGDPQIHLIPTDGGEATRLTELDKGSISHVRWSPDGDALLFVYHRRPEPVYEKLIAPTPGPDGIGSVADAKSADNDKGDKGNKKDGADAKRPPLVRVIDRLWYRLDGHGFLDDERDHIWTLRVADKKLTQLTSGPHDHSLPCWSPDGKEVAFVSNRADEPDYELGKDELWIVAASGGEPRHVPSITGPKVALAWSPDGGQLCFVGHHDPTDWGTVSYHPHLVSVRGGDSRNLCPGAPQTGMSLAVDDLKHAGGSASAPVWSADGSRILLPFGDCGSVRIHAVPVDGGELVPLTEGSEVIDPMAATPDRRRLVFLRSVLASAPELHVLDLAPDGSPAGALGKVSTVNDAFLRSVDVIAPEVVEFTTPGARVQGFLYKPRGVDPRKRYPALLEVHGGPHAFYSFSIFHEMSWLAECGYVVLATNPRGSASFGEDFAAAIKNHWGGPDYEDLMAAADYLAALPYVDGERLGILGGSYGGWMTNWVVGHSDRFKAAVTMRSVVNLVSMAGSSDFGFDFRHEMQGTIFEARDNYERQSPLGAADKITTPTLIIHAEQDLRCPLSQAQELYAALKLRRVPTRLVIYPEETHDLSRGGRPDRRIDRLERIRAWLDAYLQG